MVRVLIALVKNIFSPAWLMMGILVCINPVMGDELRKPAWFFVHTSKTATIENKKLVLPLEAKIFGFTNYLYHRSYSYMTAKEFTSLWVKKKSNFHSFNSSPPWAVLSWVQGEDVVSLEFKILMASLDSREENISYIIDYSEIIPFLPLESSYSLFIEAKCEPAGLSDFFMKPNCDCTENCDQICRTMCWK